MVGEKFLALKTPEKQWIGILEDDRQQNDYDILPSHDECTPDVGANEDIELPVADLKVIVTHLMTARSNYTT